MKNKLFNENWFGFGKKKPKVETPKVESIDPKELYDEGEKISKKLSLRPVMVTPKGTKLLLGIQKNHRIRFIKYLKEPLVWNSGVIFDFLYNEKTNSFVSKPPEYREEADFKPEYHEFVDNLQAEILNELNSLQLKKIS